jgi:hypothetical protein
VVLSGCSLAAFRSKVHARVGARAA